MNGIFLGYTNIPNCLYIQFKNYQKKGEKCKNCAHKNITLALYVLCQIDIKMTKTKNTKNFVNECEKWI